MNNEVEGRGVVGPIFEIDCLPQAYVEIHGTQDTELRIVFHAVGFVGSDPNTVRAAFDAAMQSIREALLVQCLRHEMAMPIIWWRTRPTERFSRRKQDTISWSCRLETTPPLPHAFWKKLEKVEGQPAIAV